MKIVMNLILLFNLYLNANALNLLKYGTKIEDIKSIGQIAELSNITQKSLSVSSKVNNIQDLLSLAVKENKIKFSEQFKYRKEFQNLDNGDIILLKALKQNKNLDEVLYKHSFVGQTIQTTGVIGARTTHKVIGVLNDYKSYAVKGFNGQVIGNFRPTDFYNLEKIIEMPSIIFTTGSKTSTGYLRNASIYWKKYLEKYPQDLSKNNIKLIKQNKSPIVDDTWIQSYPNHKYFKGDILEHHHLHHNGDAIPLPTTLHRKNGNYDIFHSM
jgi:hypothetical protein